MNNLIFGVCFLILYHLTIGAAQQKSVKYTTPDQFKRTSGNGANEFSIKQNSKPQNVFSYATKNQQQNNVNLKEFSFKDQINLIKSELDSGNNGKNGKNRFSYTDALNKYLQSQKTIPVTNLKANVVDFLSGIDVVKTAMGQNPETNKTRIDFNTNVQPTTKTPTNKDQISIATIKEITNLIKTINNNLQKTTTQPTTSTSTTTEQPETEAPESEQTTSGSRCYCMERCTSSMSFEGNCGSPNAAGVRKSKCCKSSGGLSSNEEGEEMEY